MTNLNLVTFLLTLPICNGNFKRDHSRNVKLSFSCPFYLIIIIVSRLIITTVSLLLFSLLFILIKKKWNYKQFKINFEVVEL